ncbi:MAG TPA: OsmC family protein [Pyrinomonadaceae bacterium]|nr:OsmC family protein [Pyrinomonadaceae bacterium]
MKPDASYVKKHFIYQTLFTHNCPALTGPCDKIFEKEVLSKHSISNMGTTPYKATIIHAGNQLFLGTPPSGHTIAIDTKGDKSTAPTPVEMLLMSVAACTAADVVSIMEKKRQPLEEYRLEVIGERVEDFPRKFISFHVHHIVRGRSISEKALADAIQLSEEKYCSVAATVRPTAEVTSSFEIVEAESAAA